MAIGSINHSATYSPASLQVAAQPDAPAIENKAANLATQNREATTAQSKVSISDEARQLQADDAAAQKATQQKVAPQDAEKDMGDKAEAFAYGALGMEHPEDVKANGDGYYNAGQWLAAAGTVATVLLAIA